uniref:Uncharacterized protein n=1 Tax=Cacopsylla melanoneura TaxID=428564 RepID=A0A8D8TRA5_9HEMI
MVMMTVWTIQMKTRTVLSQPVRPASSSVRRVVVFRPRSSVTRRMTAVTTVTRAGVSTSRAACPSLRVRMVAVCRPRGSVIVKMIAEMGRTRETSVRRRRAPISSLLVPALATVYLNLGFVMVTTTVSTTKTRKVVLR